MVLRIPTSNIQGFCYFDKQLEVVDFARRLQCALVFVQETNFLCRRDVGAYFSFAFDRFTGVGVIIFNRRLL